MLTSLYCLFNYGARILLQIEHMSVMNHQEMGQVRTDMATLQPDVTVKENRLHQL